MNNLKEEQRKEAIKRLKNLTKEYNLKSIILEEFETNEKIYFSEDVLLGATAKIEELSKNQNFMDVVSNFEKEHNALVYHCISIPKSILGKLSIYGGTLSLLYVGNDKKQWELEEVSKNGCMYAYGYNLDKEEYSEFGDIFVSGITGALSRTDIVDWIKNN